MNRLPIAIMASGTGSNAERLMRLASADQLPIDVRCLVSDRPGAPVTHKARALGVPVVAAHADILGRAAFERIVVAELVTRGVELVVLAGYMRICGPRFLEAFEGRALNLHPSLLPEHRGKNAVGAALRSGAGWTGVTVHWIDSGVDTGPVIAQERVPILCDDTIDTLTSRIQQVEHRLLPQVIEDIASTRIAGFAVPAASVTSDNVELLV